MNTLLKHKKGILISLALTVILLVIVGIYIIQSISNSANITKKQAENIVLERFGGTIIESDVDYDNFQVEYEITILDKNNREVEVIVDGNSGKILEVDYDD